MAISERDLKRYASELNRLFFDGMLPDVEIITNWDLIPSDIDPSDVIIIPQANNPLASPLSIVTEMLHQMVHVYCKQNSITDYFVNDYFSMDDDEDNDLPPLIHSPRFIEEAEKRGLIGGKKPSRGTERILLDLVDNRKE